MKITIASVLFQSEKDRNAYLPGSLSIAAVLKRAGHDVEFVTLEIPLDDDAPYAPDEYLYQSLKDKGPILGISCLAGVLPFALLAIKKIKSEQPDCRVVMGGPGPSICAEEILRHFPEVDVIAVGEGEQTVIELMPELMAPPAGRNLSGIAGIYFREAGVPRFTGERDRLPDLDSLPVPDGDLLSDIADRPIYLMTSRGCLFNCSYCTSRLMWKSRVTYRSGRHLGAELDFWKQHFHTHFSIGDDLFLADRRVARELMELFNSRGLTWGANTRCDLLTDANIAMLRENGCQHIYLGIESGSVPVLHACNKKLSVDRVLTVVDKLASSDIHVTTSFMWGFPFESLHDLEETLMQTAACRALGAEVQMHLVMPLPGTAIYEGFKDRLRFDPSLVSDIATLKPVPGLVDYYARFAEYPVFMVPFQYYHGDEMAEKIALYRSLE